MLGTMNETFNMALGFAACAHRKQKRKYTDEPYIVHCLCVGLAVRLFLDDVAVVAAALLHDTIEDCGITHAEIANTFSEQVADLVVEVTDISKPEDGNRAVRKEIDRKHLAISSPSGATIKLADLIDNTSTIVKYDKDFAKIYLAEKRLLLPFLRHGHRPLYMKAVDTLEEAEKEIL